MSGLLAPAPPRPPALAAPIGADHLAGMLPGMLAGGEDGGAQELPAELEPYEAGLQGFIAPAGVQTQTTTVMDKLTKTDDDIAEIIRAYFDDARSYDERLSDERVTASQYYNAEPFGDEEPGRSQLVLTTVRDTVRSTLPSLLRVFCGSDPVEFTPCAASNLMMGAVYAERARQATDYAHWALHVANDGWTILHDALLEMLTRKSGWVRWSWGMQRATRTEVCEGLLAPQLQMLMAEPGVTAYHIAKRPMLPREQQAAMMSPESAAYLQQGGEPMLYSARITRQHAQALPRVEALRAESVWIVADAETVATARAVFVVSDAMVGDLIAAGLPEEEVIEHASAAARTDRQRREDRARDPLASNAYRGAPPGDESLQMVRYVEGWIRCDTDGDNVAELLHVHCLGDGLNLVRWDRTDEIPLACFTAYREPCRVIGLSQADMVMDLQRTQSRVMRAVLDSLGEAIFPRTTVVVGQANMADVRQTAIGSIIRMTTPGAVAELTKPFTGERALPVLEVLEAMRESRTGITRTSQGLTAKHLQSTAPEAVGAQTSASQDRLDMIARTAAETGLAPLYAGLLRLMAKHQDRPNAIQVRGKWITVDPRAMEPVYDCQVNVGGRGTPAERIAVLSAVAAKQELIIQTGGMENPIVGLPEYRHTLASMVEAAGESYPAAFFKELPPNWQPPPPPPPKPTTDEILAEVEREKTEAKIRDDQASAQFDREKLALDDDRERDAAALNAWVAVYVAASKNGTPLPALTDFQNAMRRGVALPQPIVNPALPTIPSALPQPGAPGPLAGGMPARVPATAPPGMSGAPPPARGSGGGAPPPDPVMQAALRRAVTGVPDAATGALAARAGTPGP